MTIATAPVQASGTGFFRSTAVLGLVLAVAALMLLVVLLIPMIYYVVSTARASREYA